MKQSGIRILCGILLLGIAMGIMAGVILAIGEEEELTAWTKVTFQTSGDLELCLYDSNGEFLELLQSNKEGKCTTDLLEEGIYYGVCKDGLVQFELKADGLQVIHGRAEAVDKFSLSFFLSGQSGELRIMGRARQEWYEYELTSSDYSVKKVLRCTVGEGIACEMENLPYGSYTLLENGRILCRVELTRAQPSVELSLP